MMTDFLLNSVPDAIVLRDLPTHDRNRKSADALLIAHLAVVDERRLYLGLGYPSMVEYCTVALNHTEDSAQKRIRVGRAARKFPLLFPAIAEGRLHLSGALLLAPRLTRENAAELIAAASRQSKLAIESLLAERFPRTDLVSVIAPELPRVQVAPGPPVPCESPAQAAPMEPVLQRARVTPLAPGRIGWQTTVDEETQTLFDEFRSLVSHALPSGGMADVLKRALEIAVAHSKKRKFAVGARGPSRSATATGHEVPAAMRREVYERDGGCCAFVGEGGRRCGSTHMLELDHILPWSQGGPTTPGNLRLLCRAHNQHEAERVLGREHVQTRRALAQRERAMARAAAAADKARAAELARAKKARHDELAPGLKSPGFSAFEIRKAAELCEAIPNESLEARMKRSLSALTRHIGYREDFTQPSPA